MVLMCCENMLFSEWCVVCVVWLLLVVIRLVMVLVWVRLSLLLRNVCLLNLFGCVWCVLSVMQCVISCCSSIGLLCFCSFIIFLLVKLFGVGNYSMMLLLMILLLVLCRCVQCVWCGCSVGVFSVWVIVVVCGLDRCSRLILLVFGVLVMVMMVLVWIVLFMVQSFFSCVCVCVVLLFCGCSVRQVVQVCFVLVLLFVLKQVLFRFRQVMVCEGLIFSVFFSQCVVLVQCCWWQQIKLRLFVVWVKLGCSFSVLVNCVVVLLYCFLWYSCRSWLLVCCVCWWLDVGLVEGIISWVLLFCRLVIVIGVWLFLVLLVVFILLFSVIVLVVSWCVLVLRNFWLFGIWNMNFLFCELGRLLKVGVWCEIVDMVGVMQVVSLVLVIRLLLLRFFFLVSVCSSIQVNIEWLFGLVLVICWLVLLVVSICCVLWCVFLCRNDDDDGLLWVRFRLLQQVFIMNIICLVCMFLVMFWMLVIVIVLVVSFFGFELIGMMQLRLCLEVSWWVVLWLVKNMNMWLFFLV